MADTAVIMAGAVAEAADSARRAAKAYEELFADLRRLVREAAAGAVTPWEAAEVATTTADAAASAFHAHFPGQTLFAFRAGCAMCCHLRVKMPPQEAFRIARHIAAEWSRDRLDKVITRLRDATALLRADAPDAATRCGAPAHCLIRTAGARSTIPARWSAGPSIRPRWNAAAPSSTNYPRRRFHRPEPAPLPLLRGGDPAP
jgi:hypothetical protein